MPQKVEADYVLIHIMEKTVKNFEIALLKLGAIGQELIEFFISLMTR